MLRHRVILIAAVGTALCLSAAKASGKSIIVHRNPIRSGVAIRRYGQVHRPLFHRIAPRYPHQSMVVIRTPYGRRIKAFQSSCYRGTWRYGVVRRPVITVWITNSDGSRTAVELLQRRYGFVGPRGEWYPELPTRRRIWFKYGF